jgi:hypothetical protein
VAAGWGVETGGVAPAFFAALLVLMQALRRMDA